MGSKKGPKDTSNQEIFTQRLLKFPQIKVFLAWSDPNHLKEWWGPKGFTNIFDVFEFRPGGSWKFTMKSPEGVEFKNKSEFIEIKKPQRIFFDHISAPQFKAEANFRPEGENTHLTYRMYFETPEDCAKVREFAQEGNKEMFERLETYLKKMD